MNNPTDPKEQENDKSEQQLRDERREETNKTDPQLTELRGFIDPGEPLEEEGTINPLTD